MRSGNGFASVSRMWGRRRQYSGIRLNVEGADFCLREPGWRDYHSWHRARSQSRDALVPFEPSWRADALSRTTFRTLLHNARTVRERDLGVNLFLVALETEDVIGGINVSNIRRGVAQMANIGYWMSSEYSGAGRMTRAVRRVCEFGFDGLNLHRIEAACVPENAASAAVLLANGFEEEGFARDYLRINGRWRDHRLFAIVRRDSESAS